MTDPTPKDLERAAVELRTIADGVTRAWGGNQTTDRRVHERLDSYRRVAAFLEKLATRKCITSGALGECAPGDGDPLAEGPDAP